MKKWSDVRKGIKSLSEVEKQETDLVAELVVEIIERRESLGWTQRDLAEKSGVKQAAIARLETFKVVPRIDTLYKLLIPLGLKLGLIRDEEAATII